MRFFAQSVIILHPSSGGCVIEMHEPVMILYSEELYGG